MSHKIGKKGNTIHKTEKKWKNDTQKKKMAK